MPMIRIHDLATAATAQGLDLPGFGGAAKLSPTEVDKLSRGEAIRVKASTETRVAKLLDLRVKDIHAANDAGEEEGDAPVDYANDAPPAWDDREPVMGDAPAPRSSRREIPDEGSTVPPMEAALRAALTAGEGRYRDEDLELVGAVLSLGEAPSGISRRELEAIARGWLDLAVGVRGQEDGAPVLIERAQVEGEGRVRAMALKIAARLAAQARAVKGAKGGARGKGSNAAPQGDA